MSKLKDVLRVYLNRLVDLSSNNRSIFLPKIIASQMIDLKDFHFLNNHASFFYITELLGRKRNIPLIQVLDSRDQNVNQLSVRLKRLKQQVSFTIEETGEKSLFVGWPFVEGKLLNGQLTRCPLVFFPVELILEDKTWYLRKSVGELPFLNPSFLLAYSQAVGKPFDAEWLEASLEDFNKDPMGFRTDLYQLLKNQIELNFSREIYKDQLEFFPDNTRDFFEENFDVGLLKLKPYAILGQFSQKSSFLMDDYEQLIKESDHENLEELFSDYFVNKSENPQPTTESNLYNTFPIDSSQEAVIHHTKSGNSCVVQGPPGTGKSQLICNMVADFASRGKKVLVVSQKRAALDVVYQRVASQGMANFTALVHDYRGDRKELYKKINHQISSLENYQALNRSIDAIQLERNFSQMCRNIERYSDFFDAYKDALYDTSDCGAPVKELYLTTDYRSVGIDMTQFYRCFRLDELDGFLNDFEQYQYYYKKFQISASFWLHRVDFSTMGPEAIQGASATFQELFSVKITAKNDLNTMLADDFEYGLIYQSFQQKEKIDALRLSMIDQEIYEKFKALMMHDAGTLDLLWLENKVDMISKLLMDEGVEWGISNQEVEETLQNAVHYSKQLESLYGKISMKVNPKKFEVIKSLLEINGLKNNKEDISVLVQRLENRMNLNHQYALLEQKNWIKLPEKPFTIEQFEKVAALHLKALKARFIMSELGVLASYFYKPQFSFDHFQNLLEGVSVINDWVEDHFSNWRAYLTEIQIKHLLSGEDEGKLKEIQGNLPKDIDELTRFDKLRHSMLEEEKKVIEKLIDEFPDSDYEGLKAIFLSSLKISWISHLEAKYPVLKEIYGPQIKSNISDFENSVEEKLKIARFIIEIRLREEVCSKLEYNRLNNLISYRELAHQVGKKRQIWSVKKLIDHYKAEIFRLIPCWLASPETASALFPLEQYFDLVIFDEASQCYFERGLPLMLRGKQVVVAGDQQQLQPYDLYQTRIQTEEEDTMEVEIDALLDMVAQYFPTFHLQTHYRSETLPLIDFSNRHFYEGKLYMLPDRKVLNSGEQGLKLISVDGIWENQTNQLEAEEVILQLQSLRIKFPLDSIGIITFNYYQMMLIASLIELDETLSLDDNIRVKNIENVQGDEFDHVVFSVGYSRNPEGKFTANFGLLSRKGGENRLNVAITRARKQNILISSLKASDFKERHMKNAGIRLLKAYLVFVDEVQQGKAALELRPDAPGYDRNWSFRDRLIGNYGNHEVVENPYSAVMDLEVKEKEKAVAAILTDDQRFFASSTAKEAFVYHPRLLTSRNWNIVFLFSRQYWLDKEDLLQTKIAQVKTQSGE
ncbi:AAA domain-containing protein [uncultured Cyclobacterium sp.]|uniref:AAA domain-containing protein n=1 Tax=uncultured Cyclobacterium sp. TaxID=453820 RepID=UPI0030ED8B37|tara:strand:- start:74324 stop:78322 length:3999 start_codon:yes stop_codon:yes gene_type:complete